MRVQWRIFPFVPAIALVGILLGCAQPTPTPTPPAIQYEVGQGAAIQKVSFYLGASGVLAVDVDVKNTSTTDKKFEVAVNVDDAGFFTAGVQTGKVVKAGAALTYKTDSAVSTTYPKTLVIRVTPQ